ncbi:peptidase family M13 [Necator americanus]|uniref:Peptidase family M13 n=1 Tax=Necator americanus TaxID=51031 RepID=W2SJF6_NECAM|nr:peptidase family M13 [Necator americanus]ETN69016.1 peptidase family M13 [Necator americanus]
MTKQANHIDFIAVAVVVAAAIVIASLVLNIIILTRVNTINNNVLSPTPTPQPTVISNGTPQSTVITTAAGQATVITSAAPPQQPTVGTVPTPQPTVITNGTPQPTVITNDTKFCPNVGPANTSPAYQQAATYLLNGLDQSVDPCVDFYAFTCNKAICKQKSETRLSPPTLTLITTFQFIAQVNLTALDLNRLSTYDQAQEAVNTQIVKTLMPVDVNDDKKWSATERITKAALDACVINSKLASSLDNSKQIYNDINTWFGGVPFLGGSLVKNASIWAAVGTIEQTHALGTLLSSWVSVDYRNVSQNALYISQPSLPMPREFYVLPQFVDKLNNRAQQIEAIMLSFASDVLSDPSPYAATIKQQWESHRRENSREKLIELDENLAKVEASHRIFRNYDQQYNAYKLFNLTQAYPSIEWNDYLTNLLSSVENATDVVSNQVVLSQPSYFAWLNAIFAGNTVDQNTVVNYIITQLLFVSQSMKFGETYFLGGSFKNVAVQADYVPYAQRRGRGVTRIGRRHFRKFDDQDDPAVGCIDMLMNYMPYGPGYVYVKAQGNRDQVVKDITHQTDLVISNFQKMIGTLDWMTPDSKAAAKYKSDHILKNYGWPSDMFGDFQNFTNVDDYHQLDYFPIINAYNNNSTDYYTIFNLLKKGLENREAFRLLTEQADSIDYPQAYNYAGQGGTGGHELTHGFDDEGVQFGWDGSLTNCTWNQCGWMDATSKTGFTGMAQCVVTQYSTQCCPEKTGNVHCCNGATTQGENIADLGGQQAAYNAYQDYVKELGHDEMRLPGLEQFTPNQIFWITYGYSWCMKQSDKNLVNQLLTNPHAPGSCRTNQVMQDIPSFGKDFGCKQGSPMYPPPDQRCKVWVG